MMTLDNRLGHWLGLSLDIFKKKKIKKGKVAF